MWHAGRIYPWLVTTSGQVCVVQSEAAEFCWFCCLLPSHYKRKHTYTLIHARTRTFNVLDVLHLSFYVSHTKLLVRQTLLDLGASPDYKDSRGLTPLYHSVLVGGDPRCCELLLRHHAFVCCQDENGWNEVHQASVHTWTHTHLIAQWG